MKTKTYLSFAFALLNFVGVNSWAEPVSQKLDILWVVDNSSSMLPSQQQLQHVAGQFLDGLKNNSSLDWKIGLISTSMVDDAYVGFVSGDELNSTTPDAATKFQNAIAKLGTSGDSAEKVYEPIVKALVGSSHRTGFLRPDASLAIIVVTDAFEQSYMTTIQFLKELNDLKVNLSRTRFYGFLGPNQWCTPQDYAWDWPGSKFEEIYNFVGGKVSPICDPTFESRIRDLGSLLSISSNP